MLKVVHDGAGPDAANGSAASSSLVDAIVHDGARQMLVAALAAYIEAHSGEVDVNGHRLVVRNGYHAEREVTTVAGAVTVRAPRVNDKRIDEATGQRCRFSSAILPAWARKSPQTAEVLPLLYLHGLSTSDLAPALEQFLGTSHGLSAATITRLTEQWKDDARAFAARSLAEVAYVCVCVGRRDPPQGPPRAGQMCLLVMIGVGADGTKELVAVSDGFRESSESWADLLRDCKRRGMTAPVLAVGDGALGFWKAIRDVFPDTKEQRCWWHKIGKVLAALAKSAHPAAKKALAGICNAEDKAAAVKAAHTLRGRVWAKWPKAVAKIVDDLDVLTAVYD
jgi:putative transposase